MTALLALAAPVVATLLAQVSMTFVDTVMVGQLGPEPLAGVALGSSTYFLLLVVSFGFVLAVGPMVAQAYGAGEVEPVERSVRQGLWLALALGVPATFLVYNAGVLLRLLNQPPEVIYHSERYLHAVAWGIVPALWFIGLRTFVEALSRPWLVTILTSVGVGLNIWLNSVLMYGKFGLPALGVAGTGMATSMVNTFLFASMALVVSRRAPFREYRIFSGLSRPDPRYFRELFRIGWPIGCSLGIEHGLFTSTAFLMGLLGAAALAAHQIALQCAAVTFMVPLGIGIAGSVRVGQAAGRQDAGGVRRAGYSALLLAGLAMCAGAVLFLTSAEGIVGIFLDPQNIEQQHVVSLAVALLGIAAVFQVFDGLQVAAAGALRGLKDTRMPMFIGLFSYWGVGLTAGVILCFVQGWGARGLWWGLVTGLATAAVLLIWRFHVRQAIASPAGGEGVS